MKKDIYLTFDMDWACDEMLYEFNELLKELDISATIFVTHDTKYIDLFRENPKIELGIHPNFMNLKNDSDGAKNWEDVLHDLIILIPEAKSIRSHGLIEGSVLLKKLEDLGFEHELNLYIPYQSDLSLMPFQVFDRLWRIPFIFEDDLYINDIDLGKKVRKMSTYLELNNRTLKIFNFHPVHLFLNTETLSRYRQSKTAGWNIALLNEYKNNKIEGVKDYFIDLITEARKKGYQTKKICEWRD